VTWHDKAKVRNEKSRRETCTVGQQLETTDTDDRGTIQEPKRKEIYARYADHTLTNTVIVGTEVQRDQCGWCVQRGANGGGRQVEEFVYNKPLEEKSGELGGDGKQKNHSGTRPLMLMMRTGRPKGGEFFRDL